jgi:hypothetical protein
MQIGDTQENLIKTLGKQLRESTANPITIIYVTSGSCTNTLALYNNTPITTNPKFIPTQTEVPGWTASMAAPTCNNDLAGGKVPDIVNSNVFIEACAGQTKPADIKATQGPIQPYVFVVPKMSTQTAITAAEAYFVFGWVDGMGMGPGPWAFDAFKFIRPMDKSTLVSMAFNIKLDPGHWHGQHLPASGDVVTQLNMNNTATNAEKSIGILGAEVYDKNRTTMTALAFKGFEQTKAYWPDSTVSAKDKKNVIDGHYMIWSPTVYLARYLPGMTQIAIKSQYIIDLILGKDVTPAADFDSLASVISVGLVPECAMHVDRCGEGTDLKPYTPAAPCDCYFQSKVQNNPTPPGCTVCSAGNPCATGVCRRGFCEAR